jgi:hypothetical protein
MLARYTEVGRSTRFSKLAGDESLAVPMDSNLGSQHLYARQSSAAATVDSANAALSAISSPIELVVDQNQTRKYGVHQAGRKSKVREEFWLVEPSHNVTDESGDTMTLPKDCGKSASEVMGVPMPFAQYTTRVGRRNTVAGGYPLLAVASLLSEYLPDEATGIAALVGPWTKDLSNEDAESAVDDHVAKLLTALSARKRAALARDAKVNAYAVPDIGQGVVIVGGGDQHRAAASQWSFHMAPVVIKSADGADYVTLENFNRPTGPERNSGWTFNMYGPTPEQSIHEQQTNTRDRDGNPTGEFGTVPTTFVID